MRGYGIQMSKEGVEKTFGIKASPDSYLSPKEFMKKKMNDIVMSKPVGKILDSSIGKKMVGVGNAVIKGVKSLTNFPDEGKMNKAQDAKNRATAPVGAVGGTNKGEYRPSSFKYGVQKRKIA